MTSLSKNDPLLHEINILMRLLESNTGRDKLTKAIQYSLKIFIDLSEPGSLWHKKFSSAQGQISAARKVFRFFKFLSVYTSLLKMIDRVTAWKKVPSHLQPWLDLSGDLKSFFMGLYLFYDSVNWAGKADLLPQEPHFIWTLTQKNYKDKVVGGYHYWMYSTIIGFVTDWIKIYQWLSKYNAALSSKDKPAREIQNEMTPELNKLLRALLKDTCDVLVSSHFSGYWNPKQRWIGLFGTISAIAGGWDMYTKERQVEWKAK